MSVSISVVTACYNTSPFLDRIYSSLVKQTYRNFEWVCVDDVSKDDTVDRPSRWSPPANSGCRCIGCRRTPGVQWRLRSEPRSPRVRS